MTIPKEVNLYHTPMASCEACESEDATPYTIKVDGKDRLTLCAKCIGPLVIDIYENDGEIWEQES